MTEKEKDVARRKACESYLQGKISRSRMVDYLTAIGEPGKPGVIPAKYKK